MKTQVLTAAAVLLAALSTGSQALAQNTASANVQKYGMAVVDISYIFKNHQKFRTAMDGMKGEFQSVDGQLKQQQQKIVDAEKQKAQYTAGSPQFKELDEQVVKMKAALQVEVTQKRKGLVEREAKIYYDTYREVDAAIKQYADYKQIGLVLRFNGDEADPNNRESILRSINKLVHYQNQIDITPDVLAMLNRNASATRPAAGGARR